MTLISSSWAVNRLEHSLDHKTGMFTTGPTSQNPHIKKMRSIRKMNVDNPDQAILAPGSPEQF